MPKYFVVGATSPIGQRLVTAIQKESAENHIVAHFSRPSMVPNWWRTHEQIRPIQWDFCGVDIERAFEAAQEAEIVIWLAHCGCTTVEEEMAANVPALQAICRILRLSKKCKKLIFISSGGSIYGNVNSMPISEATQCRPISRYGRTKLRLEAVIQAELERYLILRPSNVYAPEPETGRMKGLINTYIRQHMAQKPFNIVGDPENIRDYLHVDDLVSAIMMSAKSQHNGVTWNVGTGRGLSVKDVITALQFELGEPPYPVAIAAGRQGDVDENILDYSAIRTAVGWSPTIDLEVGVQSLVALYAAQFEDVRSERV